MSRRLFVSFGTMPAWSAAHAANRPSWLRASGPPKTAGSIPPAAATVT